MGLVDLSDLIYPYIILGNLGQRLGTLCIPSIWLSTLTPITCMPISPPSHTFVQALQQVRSVMIGQLSGPHTPSPPPSTHTYMQALHQVRSVMIGQLAPIRPPPGPHTCMPALHQVRSVMIGQLAPIRPPSPLPPTLVCRHCIRCAAS